MYLMHSRMQSVMLERVGDELEVDGFRGSGAELEGYLGRLLIDPSEILRPVNRYR